MNDFSKYNFIVFCLETYRSKYHLKGRQIFDLFKNSGLFDYLLNGYEVLHTQGKNYILEDITDFLKARKDEALSR